MATMWPLRCDIGNQTVWAYRCRPQSAAVCNPHCLSECLGRWNHWGGHSFPGRPCRRVSGTVKECSRANIEVTFQTSGTPRACSPRSGTPPLRWGAVELCPHQTLVCRPALACASARVPSRGTELPRRRRGFSDVGLAALGLL